MLTRDKMSSRPDDKEFMATLAKGLAVLSCFGRQRPAMTLSEAALAANVDWLVPALAEKTAVAQISPDDLNNALTELLSWPLRRRLEAEAPTHFEAPTGTHAAIDYEAEAGPTISIRLQELFGLDQHPAIAGGRIPLVIELLSPGQKPVQITRDLPGFWRGGNCWKLTRCCPTSACAGTSTKACSTNHLT